MLVRPIAEIVGDPITYHHTEGSTLKESLGSLQEPEGSGGCSRLELGRTAGWD